MGERTEPDVAIPDVDAAGDARYRRIVEQSPLVVYTRDGSRPPAMTYVSPHVEQLLGITPTVWLEQPFLWVTRIHPDDREDVLARIDEAGLQERRFTAEYRYRTPDDRVVWVSDEAAPIRDDDGRVVYWLGALSDISDRKATEEAFKQSEQRSSLMFESITDLAMVMLDQDGTIVSWNPGAERLFGYTGRDALGQSISMFTPEERRRHRDLTADLDLAIEQGAAETEDWLVRKDGSRFWCHLVTTSVRDEQHELVGLAWVTRDLTERREAARLLAQWARQQAAVTELGMKALVNADAEPLMEEAVHVVARTLDPSVSALFLVTDEDVPPETAWMRLACGTGWARDLVGRLEVPPEPGSPFWHSLVKGRPIVAPGPAQVDGSLPSLLTAQGVVAYACIALRVGGRPIGVMLAASDRAITFEDNEINFLQAIANVVGSSLERTRTNETLKLLDADRSRLLARVLTSQEEERAHVARELHDELAQTLAGITLFAASLGSSSEGRDKEMWDRIGEMAEDAAEAVRRLIGNLRPLELEDGLVSATERLVEVAGSWRGVPIEFLVEGDPHHLPDQVEVAVYRIVQEGLRNVGKHAPRAEAGVTLRFHERSLEVEIGDEGSGFEAWETASSGGEHVGLLGMSERAAQIGGVLELDSAPGRGTSVRLRVPVDAARGERDFG